MNEVVTQKLHEFFEPYHLQSIGAGQRILSPGDSTENVIYLVSGSVKQYDISDKGIEVVVNVFKENAFFPLYLKLLNVSNQYFFDSLTDVKYKLAPATKVLDFLKTNNDVTLDLLARVYSGAIGQQRRMVHLMGGTARSRLIFELVTAVKRFGEFSSDGSVTLAMHEEDIAKLSGLSRETVSRELKKLKDENLVSIINRKLSIANVTLLEDLLGDKV